MLFVVFVIAGGATVVIIAAPFMSIDYLLIVAGGNEFVFWC